jgi:hypothetical protein
MAFHVKKLALFVLIAAALSAPASAEAGFTDLLTAHVAGLSAQPPDAIHYDWARKCTGHAQVGALDLQNWLATNVPGVSWGIYSCRKVRVGSSLSLHAEGRAVDWHLDVKKRADRAVATDLINAFLAPDVAGTPHAMARRMGIQEIIWNCRIWSANYPDAGMRPYSVCRRKVSRTEAHKDHLHIGLNWRGARAQTTYWRSIGAGIY